MNRWRRKLFVFRDEDGRDYVSAACPTSAGAYAAHVRAYLAEGPYMPIGWPKPVLVDNAAKWMADRVNEGFSFEPSAID